MYDSLGLSLSLTCYNISGFSRVLYLLIVNRGLFKSNFCETSHHSLISEVVQDKGAQPCFCVFYTRETPRACTVHHRYIGFVLDRYSKLFIFIFNMPKFAFIILNWILSSPLLQDHFLRFLSAYPYLHLSFVPVLIHFWVEVLDLRL